MKTKIILLAVAAFTFSFLLATQSLASSRTVFATGQPIYADLRGKDGRNGRPGRDGKDGYCVGTHDPQGGANGENGQDGEKGEDSDDLYVHYQYQKDLGLVRVNLLGGEGGLGGKPGRGGRGCNGGSDGFGGRPGSKGKDGYNGKLFMVPHLNPLAAVAPKETITFEQWSNEPVILSDNVWREAPEVKSWLGSNSFYLSTAKVWIKRNETKIQLDWKASRPISEFKDHQVGMTLVGEKLFLTADDGMLFETDVQNQGGITTVRVIQAALASEVTHFQFQEIRGEGQGLELVFKDYSGISGQVLTTFWGRIEAHEWFPVFVKKYQGDIRQDLVRVEGDLVIVRIGALEFDEKFKDSGTSLKFQWNVRRRLGDNEVSLPLSWKGKIP